MALSRTMSPVERRIFRSTMTGQRTSASMPTSVTSTLSPKYRARDDMPVRCRVMLTLWLSVTDWGVQDTPSATTPLSAAKTSTRHDRSSRRTCPVIPARRTA